MHVPPPLRGMLRRQAVLVALALLVGCEDPRSKPRVAVDVCHARKVLILTADSSVGKEQGKQVEVLARQICGEDVPVVLEALDANDEVALETIRRHASSPPSLVISFIQFYSEAARVAFPEADLVMTIFGNPLVLGFADSISKPGRKTTGYSRYRPLMAKRLETLKEAFPGIRKVALLTDDYHGGLDSTRREIAAAQVESGVSIQLVIAPQLQELISAIDRLEVDAYYIVTTFPAYHHPKEVAAAVRRRRVPAVYEDELFVEAGGLLSVQSDNSEMMISIKQQVRAILAGASASDIPFERPKSTRRAINLDAFESLPQASKAVLLEVDRIVEDRPGAER